MLNVENLSVFHGDAQALDDVSLDGRARARSWPSSAPTAPERPR